MKYFILSIIFCVGCSKNDLPGKPTSSDGSFKILRHNGQDKIELKNRDLLKSSDFFFYKSNNDSPVESVSNEILELTAETSCLTNTGFNFLSKRMFHKSHFIKIIDILPLQLYLAPDAAMVSCHFKLLFLKKTGQSHSVSILPRNIELIPIERNLILSGKKGLLIDPTTEAQLQPSDLEEVTVPQNEDIINQSVPIELNCQNLNIKNSVDLEEPLDFIWKNGRKSLTARQFKLLQQRCQIIVSTESPTRRFLISPVFKMDFSNEVLKVETHFANDYKNHNSLMDLIVHNPMPFDIQVGFKKLPVQYKSIGYIGPNQFKSTGGYWPFGDQQVLLTPRIHAPDTVYETEHFISIVLKSNQVTRVSYEQQFLFQIDPSILRSIYPLKPLGIDFQVLTSPEIFVNVTEDESTVTVSEHFIPQNLVFTKNVSPERFSYFLKHLDATVTIEEAIKLPRLHNDIDVE